jgi:hypothetical protein
LKIECRRRRRKEGFTRNCVCVKNREEGNWEEFRVTGEKKLEHIN